MISDRQPSHLQLTGLPRLLLGDMATEIRSSATLTMTMELPKGRSPLEGGEDAKDAGEEAEEGREDDYVPHVGRSTGGLMRPD